MRDEPRGYCNRPKKNWDDFDYWYRELDDWFGLIASYELAMRDLGVGTNDELHERIRLWLWATHRLPVDDERAGR